MIIVGLSNSKVLAKKIAQKLNLDYENLEVRDSHEGEIHVKFKNNFKDNKVVLIQSLYPHPNYSLFEVLFAAGTARDLGAKEVIYVAPYLGYLREDNRKEKGECVGSKVIGDILSRNVDSIVTVEPHFHQHSKLKEIFSVPLHKLECGEVLRSYVSKNFKDYEVVGVGERAKVLAKHMSSDFKHFEKGNLKESFEGKKIVFVDDIISSGGSMLKNLEKVNADEVQLLTVHGLFVGDAYNNLKSKVKKIVSSNTLDHESNGLDISGLIAGKLMEI